MFTKEMMNKLMEDLKEDQRIHDQDLADIYLEYDVHGSDCDLNVTNIDDRLNSDIKADLERAKRRGCTKAQAEEATKVLQYSAQDIIDDVWLAESDDTMTMEELCTEDEEEDNMKNIMKKTVNKTLDTCNNMMKKTNVGFITECVITGVAYIAILCYGYSKSFNWLVKLFRKEMTILDYIKKAAPVSIITGCIGWCIGRNAEHLADQYIDKKYQETDI